MNEESLRYAADHAKNGLFKYRCFGTEQDRDRVKLTLKNGEIYFPSRLELNDPFELQIGFRMESSQKKVTAGLLKSAQRAGRRRGATAKDIMATQEKLRIADPEPIRAYVEQFHNERMGSNCLIYCLCAEPDNPILWAHYADSHKGICIGFDAQVHPFDGACGINYSQDYPVAGFPRQESDDESLFLKSALTKSIHWQYENEFRLCSVRMGDNPTWDLNLRWIPPQVAVVDPGTINSLYLGARMPPERRTELIDYCRSERPDITIFVASANSQRYKLDFAELS